MYGHLRPWLFQGDEKFFRTHLTPTFANPSTSIDEYYKVLKSIFNNHRELFDDESLDVYLQKPHSNSEYQILQPIIELTLPPATNAKERFYYALIKNEATRTSNNVFQALSKKLQDYDRKYIVNVFKSNLVAVLSNFSSVVQSLEAPDATALAILNALKLHTVQLLKETELLYPQFLNSLPSDDAQIFMEFLKEEIPEDEIFTKSGQESHIRNSLLQTIANVPLRNIVSSNAFSFGFKGDGEALKIVLLQLSNQLDLVKQPTTAEHLLTLLTTKDIKTCTTEIFIGCETTEFRYIIDLWKPYFKKLTPTNIEKSNLFRSKDHPSTNLNAQNLYSSKHKDKTKNQTTIDNIFKHMK